MCSLFTDTTETSEHGQADGEEDDDDDDDAVPTNEITVSNIDGESELSAAVRADDISRIQCLVQRGSDCNAVCKCEF